MFIASYSMNLQPQSLDDLFSLAEPPVGHQRRDQFSGGLASPNTNRSRVRGEVFSTSPAARQSRELHESVPLKTRNSEVLQATEPAEYREDGRENSTPEIHENNLNRRGHSPNRAIQFPGGVSSRNEKPLNSKTITQGVASGSFQTRQNTVSNKQDLLQLLGKAPGLPSANHWSQQLSYKPQEVPWAVPSKVLPPDFGIGEQEHCENCQLLRYSPFFLCPYEYNSLLCIEKSVQLCPK